MASKLILCLIEKLTAFKISWQKPFTLTGFDAKSWPNRLSLLFDISFYLRSLSAQTKSELREMDFH